MFHEMNLKKWQHEQPVPNLLFNDCFNKLKNSPGGVKHFLDPHITELHIRQWCLLIITTNSAPNISEAKIHWQWHALNAIRAMLNNSIDCTPWDVLGYFDLGSDLVDICLITHIYAWTTLLPWHLLNFDAITSKPNIVASSRVHEMLW